MSTLLKKDFENFALPRRNVNVNNFDNFFLIHSNIRNVTKLMRQAKRKFESDVAEKANSIQFNLFFSHINYTNE